MYCRVVSLQSMFGVKIVFSARRTNNSIRVFGLLGGTVYQFVELHLPPIVHFIEIRLI
jgi:hypothetical protein